jgi:elongation factor 2
VGKTDIVFKMCASLGVTLTTEDKELQEKKLIKVIMQRWLNAADALLEMMILHLPSPIKAQA